MNFTEFRKYKISQQRKENLIELRESVINGNINKNYLEKLKKHYEKYKDVLILNDIDSFQEFMKQCKTNVVLLLGLEKDPIKQSIDEKLQIEWYNKKYKMNIQKLNGNGKSSLCFDIRNTEKITIKSAYGLNFGTGQRTKTFDAQSTNNKIMYYFLKFTEESGGAQDNQIKDIEMLLKYSAMYLKQNSECKEKFVAILGGKYMKRFILKFKEKYPQIEICFMS